MSLLVVNRPSSDVESLYWFETERVVPSVLDKGWFVAPVWILQTDASSGAAHAQRSFWGTQDPASGWWTAWPREAELDRRFGDVKEWSATGAYDPDSRSVEWPDGLPEWAEGPVDQLVEWHGERLTQGRHRVQTPARPNPSRAARHAGRERTVAVLIPLTDGRFVALRHAKRGGVELPGGHVEPGETDADAAAREVFEETGLRTVVLEPLGAFVDDGGRRTAAFVARGARGAPRASVEGPVGAATREQLTGPHASFPRWNARALAALDSAAANGGFAQGRDARRPRLVLPRAEAPDEYVLVVPEPSAYIPGDANAALYVLPPRRTERLEGRAFVPAWWLVTWRSASDAGAPGRFRLGRWKALFDSRAQFAEPGTHPLDFDPGESIVGRVWSGAWQPVRGRVELEDSRGASETDLKALTLLEAAVRERWAPGAYRVDLRAAEPNKQRQRRRS